MAPRLKLLWLVVAFSAVAANLPRLESAAFAAGLDAKGEATAKEASGLYRQGLYEDAAKLFAKLVVDYPDMLIFERSLGACFYYLRKPEPALSNLRNYLVHRKDIPADDKAVVDRWIDEMEKLRAQNAAVPGVPAPTAESLQRPHLDGPPAWQPSEAPALPPPTAELQPLISQSPATARPLPPQAQPIAQESVVSTGQQASGTTNGSGMRVAGIACGALGLASIGTAIYYYTRATSLSDKVTSANPASSSDYQAGKDAETMQWVFYGFGAGALATGAALYLLGYSQASSAQVGLAPMLGPRTAGLSARGGF
ncbi:MAG: hypothetical protein WCG85_14005 [Polyangia bacterium]